MSLHPDTVRRIREFFGGHRCCKCDKVAARFCQGQFFCPDHFVPARRKRDASRKVSHTAAGPSA
ncbi:MAG TPA: hypothetical protein VG013_39425 [Gemmataceae bacterium]|jgi:hypothetical protein|nr:hypothetical protein [Gemmataceae bacterium]HZY89531.1 hypothetical protein [Gemmataceae bacterium]